MGLWDNILDGFSSGMQRRGPNYVKKQRAARVQLEGLMAQVALRAWRDYQSRRESDSRRKTDARGLDVHASRSEWHDGDFVISVADGYSRDYDRYITDILVIPTVGNPNNGRQHVGIDDNGSVLFNEWHEG